MLDIYTVSFFGHRKISNIEDVENKLEKLIRSLLISKDYVEFLVGREGDFDVLVASCIKRIRREVRSDNSELIWVLPYSTSELRKNVDYYEQYFDSIEICQKSEKIYYKAAYQMRNICMIERSELIICYVDHKNGGAYRSIEYARCKYSKKILNLADASSMQGIDKFVL